MMRAIVTAVLLLAASVRAVGNSTSGCRGRFYDVRQHANFHRLPMDTCGENNGDRIVGGMAANLGEFPWMVRIGYLLENCTAPTEYRCGGALITPDVVITAAHCTTNLPINRCKSSGEYVKFYPSSVRLGEHAIDTDPDCEQGVCAEKVQDIDVAEIITHPKYNTPKLRHDIAVLKLKSNADFNGWVNALCLVAGDGIKLEKFLSQKGIVAGWGLVDPKTNEASKELMKLYVPVVNMCECKKAFQERAKLSSRHQVCAGGVKGQDSCSGDSGGPLFVVDDSDTGPKYRLLGIVSFGFKQCAEKPLPAVYTNALYYAKWIMDNL